MHTRAQRSYNMSRIRGTNTHPELLLRRGLWKLGLRYRIKTKIPGRPDIAFISARVAVFIDGCFWHGCETHLKWPKKNAKFWRAKILQNRARDSRVSLDLTAAGWHLIRLWEHEIGEDLPKCIARVVSEVRARAKLKHKTRLRRQAPSK